jgi:hypothetical protein
MLDCQVALLENALTAYLRLGDIAQLVLCDNSDAVKNERFQDVRTGSAQGTCFSAGSLCRYADRRGSLGRAWPQRNCLPIRSVDVDFAGLPLQDFTPHAGNAAADHPDTPRRQSLPSGDPRLPRLTPFHHPVVGCPTLMETLPVVIKQILGQQ